MKDLLKAARVAQKRAYAPYSKFKVGAALRTADGGIYAGCNVENVAYPQGWCAEASAIAAMIGDGKKKIVECLVVGPGPLGLGAVALAKRAGVARVQPAFRRVLPVRQGTWDVG